MGKLESIRQVFEPTQRCRRTVVGNDLMEIHRFVKGAQFFHHVWCGFQLQCRTEMKLAQADASPRDAGEGAFRRFVLDGQMTGVVVQADEFEEVLILGVLVVVEAEEFQHFTTGFKEAQGLRLQAEMEIMPASSGYFFNVLAAKAQILKDGLHLITTDFKSFVRTRQGTDTATDTWR